MYRHSAQIPASSNLNQTALFPSPATPSDDSESDILEALDRKRRQLDEEIAKFNAAKDKEFFDFERDLRAKKQKRRKNAVNGQAKENVSPAGRESNSSTTAVRALSLLAASNRNPVLANGHAGGKPKKDPDHKATQSIPKPRPAPLSKPTLSIERLTIKGETTPPLTILGTPPSQSKLSKSVSRSPTDTTTMLPTPPRQRQTETKATTPRTPVDEVKDSFVGIFAPAYLPLLESRDSPQHVSPLPQTQPQRRTNSFSFPSQSTSQSLSPSISSPGTLRSQRAQTEPAILPSTSLPSALRTSSSGSAGRKPKHVTFQLADSAIVEPSSSYEEGMSPDLAEHSDDEGTRFDYGDGQRRGIDEVLTNGDVGVNGNAKHEEGKDANEEEIEAGMEDTESPSSFSWRPLRSPTIKSRERGRLGSDSSITSNSNDSYFEKAAQNNTTSVPGARLEEAFDGGSGVGFFELDEELSSPGAGAVRPFDFDDGEDAIGGKYAKKGEGDEEDDDDTLGSGTKKLTYEYSGSVPIDIVRPTGSWVGSFGH